MEETNQKKNSFSELYKNTKLSNVCNGSLGMREEKGRT